MIIYISKKMDELRKIQQELKAPKARNNSFAGFQYRKTSDILEAVKPLLKKHDCQLVLSDEVRAIGSRIYVQAVATLQNKDGGEISASGWAREQETKKGFDEAQITGASASYAHKIALQNLFALDDSDRDPDQNDNRGEGGKGFDLATILDTIEGASEISDLSDLYDEYSKKIQGEELQKFKDALSKKRIELQAKK